MSRLIHNPVLPEARRCGRAGLWILLIAAGLGALVYLQTQGGSNTDGPAGARAAGPLENPRATAPTQDLAAGVGAGERTGPAAESQSGSRSGSQAAPRPVPHAAPGSGRIRGELQVQGKRELGPWTLQLVPSLGMRGTEGATPRTLEFEAGVREFELSDLPLAAFDLIPEAEGFNGRRVPVLLSPTRGEVGVVLGSVSYTHLTLPTNREV